MTLNARRPSHDHGEPSCPSALRLHEGPASLRPPGARQLAQHSHAADFAPVQIAPQLIEQPPGARRERPAYGLDDLQERE